MAECGLPAFCEAYICATDAEQLSATEAVLRVSKLQNALISETVLKFFNLKKLFSYILSQSLPH